MVSTEKATGTRSGAPDPDPGRGPHPGPLRPPPGARAVVAFGLLAGAIAVTWTTFWWIGLSPVTLAAGLGDTWRLLERMLPPEAPDAGDALALIVETLLIAVAGTGLATIASLPLAFAAARAHGGSRAVRSAARLVIVLTRAVPTLVFAILFVRVFGLGPLAGALAVAVHSIGMIAKMLTDAIEEADPVPAEAVRACGASGSQVAVSNVLPRVLPALVSIVLYRLDINIRASSVLGVVGAGGIGVALQTALGSLDYDRAAGIICLIIALIMLLELLSVALRRRAGAGRSAHDSAVLLPAGRARHDAGWDRGRVLRFAAAGGGVLVFAYSLWSLDASPERLADAWPNVRDVLAGMWAPAFSTDIVMGVLESLLMALGAASVGALGGLGLALLTAVNVAPLRPLSAAVRTLVVVIRGIPDLVYALLFVAALGLGPFAGFLALWISCTALAAKFFTDSLEQLDPVPQEALTSVGATRPQSFLGGVWPRFVPSFTGHGLFVADLALRESIVLGVVGAGGIGYLMQESIATLRYDVTSAIIISIAVVVYGIEVLARTARKHLM